MTKANELINLEERYGAHNYNPLDVVISRAEGAKAGDGTHKVRTGGKVVPPWLARGIFFNR